MKNQEKVFSTSKSVLRKRKNSNSLSYEAQQLLGIKNTYMTNEEWVAMSDEDKEAVRAIRNRVKRNKSNKQREMNKLLDLAKFEIDRLGLIID